MKTEIEKYNPCKEAIKFRNQYATFKEAWEACLRGDWMLWIAKKVDVELRKLTKAKALCALTVRHLMKDERSIKACEVALRFGNGEATRDELNATTAAAYAAAADAYAVADAAADAYAAAAYAADAAAAYAAAADADAAAAAADAAAAYAADADAAARIKNQLETAKICREVLTDAVLQKVNQ